MRLTEQFLSDIRYQRMIDVDYMDKISFGFDGYCLILHDNGDKTVDIDPDLVSFTFFPNEVRHKKGLSCKDRPWLCLTFSRTSGKLLQREFKVGKYKELAEACESMERQIFSYMNEIGCLELDELEAEEIKLKLRLAEIERIKGGE